MGLDVGTSAVKGVTITEEGRIVAEAKRNVTFAKPQPGRFEVDPEEHYRSITGVISDMVAATRGSGKNGRGKYGRCERKYPPSRCGQ